MMFQGSLKMDLAKRRLEVVDELPGISCHHISAQLNLTEVHLNICSRTSKSINFSLEMLDSICQVIQNIATAVGDNELYDNCVQNDGSCDHKDIYPSFNAYAKNKCLVLLSWVHHRILKDNKKFGGITARLDGIRKIRSVWKDKGE